MKYILSFLTIYLIFLSPKFDMFGIKQKFNETVYFKIDKSDMLLRTVNLEEFQNEFFDGNPIIKSKDKSENIDLKISLSTPKLFRFYSLKPQTSPLIIFVQPGDSLTYKLGENNSIIFEGKNACHYNFFNRINDNKFIYPNYDEKEGIWKYKEKVELTYKKRLDFLKQYSKNENTSKMFTKRIKDVLEYEYYNRLLNRFMIPNEEIIQNPKYLSGIDYNLFTKNDQEDNGYFYLALSNYLHFLSVVNDTSEGFSMQKLEFLLNSIDENLSGNIKEFAITKTLTEYHKHLKLENKSFFNSSVIDGLAHIKEKKYKDALEQIKQSLTSLASELPKEVLNSKLIDIDGNSITLEEILKNNSGNVKVIDFWASWCAPCISEIKKSYQLRNKLTEEKKTVFLYFSIDKSQEKWKSKITELKKYWMDKNQYLISEAAISALGACFSISSIPKYVILNPKNNIYMNTAPSPGSTEFEEILNSINK